MQAQSTIGGRRRARYIPPMVKAQMLFGGFFSQFGWLFFGLTLVFLWVAGVHIDFSSVYHFRGDTEITQGVVTRIETTGMTGPSSSRSRGSRGTPIYRYYYTYSTPDNIEYQGVSYITGRMAKENEQVPVEYREDRPSISRIEGMRRDIFEWYLGFFFILPLVGVIFIVVGLTQGARAVRLLTYGQPSLAVLVSKTPTSTRINNRRVYKFTFKFNDPSGRQFEAVAKTHKPEQMELDDQARAAILYNPSHPSDAVVLCCLSGSPYIDPRGHVRMKSTKFPGWVVLIVPLAVVIGHSTYAYIKYFAR